MDSLRATYLENMGIPVWVERGAATELDSESEWAGLSSTALKLGPGKGSRLFICARVEDQSGRMTADIARAAGKTPVWAWPAEDGEGPVTEDAVNEGLFTSVVIFGEKLAAGLLGDPIPDLLGSARVVVLPAMEDLHASPDVRAACWAAMVAGGVVTMP